MHGSPLRSLVASGANSLLTVPLAVGQSVLAALVVVFLSLYWLLESPRFWPLVLSLLPPASRDDVAAVAGDIGHAIGGYFRGAAINAAVMGVLAATALAIAGVPYPLVLVWRRPPASSFPSLSVAGDDRTAGRRSAGPGYNSPVEEWTTVRRRPARDPHDDGDKCEDTAVLGEVLEFMRSIWGISHGLQSTSKKMEAELGITGPQRLVVRILGRCPGASAGQLAKILHLHPSTLTGVLRRLQTRGILQRTPGPTDRREARLRLTAAGRAIDRRRAGTVEDAVRGVLRSLPASKIQTAAEVMRAVETALNGPPVARNRVRRGVRRSR